MDCLTNEKRGLPATCYQRPHEFNSETAEVLILYFCHHRKCVSELFNVCGACGANPFSSVLAQHNSIRTEQLMGRSHMYTYTYVYMDVWIYVYIFVYIYTNIFTILHPMRINSLEGFPPPTHSMPPFPPVVSQALRMAPGPTPASVAHCGSGFLPKQYLGFDVSLNIKPQSMYKSHLIAQDSILSMYEAIGFMHAMLRCPTQFV